MDIQFFLQNRNLVKTFQLYISGFPSNVFISLMSIDSSSVNQGDLLKMGICQKIRIDKNTQKKTHGFVDFYNIQQMLIALQMTNQMTINGESVIVEPSKNCIVICNYCRELGHWKNQCQERLYQKENVLDVDKWVIFLSSVKYTIPTFEAQLKEKEKQLQKQQQNQKTTYNQEAKPVNTVSPLNETIYNIDHKQQLIEQSLQFVQIVPLYKIQEYVKINRQQIIHIPIQLQQYQDQNGGFVLIEVPH